MLTKHATYDKLFWLLIVLTRRVFWDHCQQNWNILTSLTSAEPKTLPLTYSSIITKRYVVSRSNCTLFLNRFNKRNLLVWFFVNCEETFEVDPCTNYLVIPRLPDVHLLCVTRQQYEILILDISYDLQIFPLSTDTKVSINSFYKLPYDVTMM